MSLFATTRLKLGADGMRPYGVVKSDGCCVDPICAPFCETACSFLDLLPTGPMWDRQKLEVSQFFASQGQNCDGLVFTPECPSMVSYAIYGARALQDMVRNILWPAIRESRPETAVTTLDDWLDRYGWPECERANCGSVYYPMSATAAAETDQTVCGQDTTCTVHCSDSYAPEFAAALKHATLLSLRRAQRGVIRNLDGINWVIAPLGASISPATPWPDDVVAMLAGDCDIGPDGPPCFCDVAKFVIKPNAETIAGAPTESGPCGADPTPVAALQQCIAPDAPINPVYPGVAVAAIIANSLLTKKCPTIISIE